jgi:hypothetical protein
VLFFLDFLAHPSDLTDEANGFRRAYLNDRFRKSAWIDYIDRYNMEIYVLNNIFNYLTLEVTSPRNMFSPASQ